MLGSSLAALMCRQSWCFQQSSTSAAGCQSTSRRLCAEAAVGALPLESPSGQLGSSKTTSACGRLLSALTEGLAVPVPQVSL